MTTIGTIPCFHPHTGSPAIGKYEACFGAKFPGAISTKHMRRRRKIGNPAKQDEPRQPQAGL
jgi:hypothetical protein